MKKCTLIINLLMAFNLLFTGNVFSQINIDSLGNAGIGTPTPSATLDLEGILQLKDSTQGENKVLTSDSLGNASWQNLSPEIILGAPAPPQTVSTNLCVFGVLGIGSFPRSVALQGNFAYIVDSGTDDLKVIDISNPANPLLIDSLAIGPIPTSIAVQGNYAFVVDLISEDLKVIDISNPSNLTLSGNLGIGSSPQSVVVQGNYAYVIDLGTDDLKVIDISTPTNPVLIDSLLIGSAPTSLAVQGNYVYVVDNGTNDLKIIDITNPANPTLIDSLIIGSIPRSVAVQGNYAYVVDNGTNDLKIIDINNPANPILIDSLVLWSNPQSIAVHGNYVTVVDLDIGDLKVIDVSNPANSTLSGSLGMGSTPRSVVLQGNYAYVVDAGTDDLKVINLFCETQVGIVISPATGSLSYQNLLWQNVAATNSIFNIDNTIVGIGTSNPQDKLTVNSDAIGISQESNDGSVGIGTSADTTLGAFLQTHSNHSLNFATNNSNAQLTLDTAGNVGIGTSTPDAKLDVKQYYAEFNVLGVSDGASTVLTTKHIGLNSKSPQSRYEGRAANYTDIGQDASGNFVIEQNNSKEMVVMPGGNVGIGTVTPSEKLEVNGNVKVNGNTNADNMLRAEAFYAYLANRDDFTTSSTISHTNLKYTNVIQNSDVAVFSMNTSTGALTFLQPGVVKVNAQFNYKFNSGYVEMFININGSLLSWNGATSNDDWQQVHGDLVREVAAGDVLTLTTPPSQITSMDNGPWSTLSVVWIGGNVPTAQQQLDRGLTPFQLFNNGFPLDSLYGKTYQGGLIAYLNTSTGTGFVAAPTDQGNYPWGCYGTAIPGADGTAIGTGDQNTIDIEAGCTSVGIAADICANLTINGYSDWFLPSKDELNELIINKVAIGLNSNSPYWSSTEFDDTGAWFQYSLNGSQGLTSKFSVAWVRSIRTY